MVERFIRLIPVSGNKIPPRARLQDMKAKIANPGIKLFVRSAIAPTIGGAMKLVIPPIVIRVAMIRAILRGSLACNSIIMVIRVGI